MYEFTLKAYSDLIKFLLSKDYTFVRINDFLGGREGVEKIILLKHDVDKKPINALNMAKLENKLGITSTYHFRIKKSVYHVDIIKQIEALGHEIGYHYEELSVSGGDYKKAIAQFENNLNTIKKDFLISTISMHGSPLSKFNNKDIWNVYNIEKYNLKSVSTSIQHFSDFYYVTDTGRCFNKKKYNVRDYNNVNLNKLNINKISLFINEDFSIPNRILFNFHPQRWTDNTIEWVTEYFIQKVKNQIKRIFKKIMK
jgi:hypothetical protein